VLLVLHGSKDSVFPYARYLGRTARLEESFAVAYWDRRGSGKSATRDVPPDSITIEQYVADTLELAAWLKGHFGSPKIAVLPHRHIGVEQLRCLCQRKHPNKTADRHAE